MSTPSPVGQDSNFSKLLGIHIDKAENGEAQARMSMQEHLLNLHGRMHGGAAGSMTLECKVNYIRAVEQGEILCTARVLNAGRKVHVLEAKVEQAGKLIATAQATFICK